MLRSCLSTLRNLNTNKLPVVVDLFSGCGGLAFGFKTAGFTIHHGMDIVQAAVSTASYNLYWRDGLEGKHLAGNVTEVDSNVFKEGIGEEGCIVIGGPPCQAYSQIGRAKLRSLGEHRVHTNDSRGFLFQDFVRIALELNAKAIVMENVPEAVDYGGLNVPQHVCEILEVNGYRAYWTILNAANFGVPQTRERVFVIAHKTDFVQSIQFPIPTHAPVDDKISPLQSRYKRYEECPHFQLPVKVDSNLPKWVTAGDALSDLPVLFPNSRSKYQLYKPSIQLPYVKEAENTYQQLMRNWFGKKEYTVSGHSFRRTARDFPIFEAMQPGDDYRAASMIAEDLLEQKCKALSVDKVEQKDLYEQLRAEIVPPYDREKFHSKWKKIDRQKPSHTLVAHLSTDTYSHLHPLEPRGITVREAARLQSFPDGFLFQCTMGDAFKQIGNAVPPLLAKAIAQSIKMNLIKNEKAIIDEFVV
jgi:DNA-methyltransferase (dcm)